jgi:N-acetylglucosaminyldiphosphoundecaprenol N-acetyl-beta-D-mannosaminyltransferase
MRPTQQILGIHFLSGSASAAVEQISRSGGVVVVPAAPAMVRLRRDAVYRDAMVRADLAIPDSGLMVLVWEIMRREHLPRVSGLAYLKRLVQEPSFRKNSFCVLPTNVAKTKLLAWATSQGLQLEPSDCYVAPVYGNIVEDRQLLSQIDSRRPAHILIAIGNGPQEKLGLFLRDHLSYRPAIHCIGAALGFLTGDQIGIPDWADRFYLGWLFRLFAQPRVFVPRLTRALALPWIIFRHGEELPPLRRARDRKSEVSQTSEGRVDNVNREL